MAIKLFQRLTICFFGPREKVVGRKGVKRGGGADKRGIKGTDAEHLLCASHDDGLIIFFISYSPHNNLLGQV